MHVKKDEKDTVSAITVRIPHAQYEGLKQYSAERGLSLNSVVAEAIAQYQTRIQREGTLKELEAFQQQLSSQSGNSGGPSDSVTLLRELRLARSQNPDERSPSEP